MGAQVVKGTKCDVYNDSYNSHNFVHSKYTIYQGILKILHTQQTQFFEKFLHIQQTLLLKKLQNDVR